MHAHEPYKRLTLALAEISLEPTWLERKATGRRIVLLLYVSTEEQDVDILTKALSKCKFEFHIDRIGVTNNPFLVEGEC